MRPKWGICMSLVYISNTVVSHFEELVMSLSVFNPSLCCLSPFYLVLCCCFMTILPVHKKFNISIMGLKSRKFWLKKWVTVDAPLISWGDTFIFKMTKKSRQMWPLVSKPGFHMLGKSEMITIPHFDDKINEKPNHRYCRYSGQFRRIRGISYSKLVPDFCDGWQSFENSNLYYWGCWGSMSNFC